jgi:hypothetical protein
MVATVKQKTVYKCEVCDKTHNTLKAAEKCENSHEETRIKQEKEAAERMKLHDTLVNIRMTSESFTELNERALSVLKEHYGDDFEINIHEKQRYSSWTNASCTYVLSKKVNKDDYFARFACAKNEIDSSNILSVLGFKTGSGSGDGKTYRWQVTYELSSFPMIEQKMKEREIAVLDCEHEITVLANATMCSMYDNIGYVTFKETEEELRQRIDYLREQLDKVEAEKQQYIKDNFYNQYEAKACTMIAALPKGFEVVYPDPRPSAYFSIS